MKYYKIQFGYGESDYLPITENELHKAVALFIQGNGRGIFENGAIRGQDIMRIIPDWHADQGWNRGWKMQAEDYQAIKSLENPYRETYQTAKNVAEMAIKQNKLSLLSKPLSEIVDLLPDLVSKKLLA